LLTTGCGSEEAGHQDRDAASLESDGGAETQFDAGTDAGRADAGDEEDTFTAFPCTSEGGLDWQLDEVELSQQVDFFALTVATSYGRSVQAERGVACSSAADVNACVAERTRLEAELEETIPDCPGEGPCFSVSYVVTTQADQVTLRRTKDEITALLGPITNAPEANFYFHTQGYAGESCGDAAKYAFKTSGEGVLIRTVEEVSMCSPLAYDTVTRLVRTDSSIEEVARKTYSSDPDGCIVYGRRPEGLRARGFEEISDRAGRFFARAAHLEAASVPAFEKIARELEALAAPPELRRKARQAKRDEIRHALSMGALARRFGAEPATGELTDHPLRTVFELALDNAVEGCVHETFAALLGAFQTEHAQDPQVRRVMATIAEDELRHAVLAWQIAAWLMPQLSTAQHARVREAQRAAVAALRQSALEEEAEELRRLTGLPSAEQALTLVASLEQTLWGPALRAA